GLSLLAHHLLEDLLTVVALTNLTRQEDHPDAVAARRREGRHPRCLELAAEERVGDLDEDAGTVAGQRIASAGTPVGEIAHHRERLLDDLVRALALHVHDEPDAAGVAFGAGIEEPRGLADRPHGSSLLSAGRARGRRTLPGIASGGVAISGMGSCTRSVWVESTTMVSVRATPSIERIRLMSSSSDEVLAVFALRSSVHAPVT